MKFLFCFIFPLLFSVSHAVRSVMIGDSLFWSGLPFLPGNPSHLAEWLMTWAGHDIEDYALVGASVNYGGIKSIPEQYLEIVKYPQITTLIMDGGGNDAITFRNHCEQLDPVCVNMIHETSSLVRGVLGSAYMDGILHVIYLGFYYLPGLEKAADLAYILFKKECDDASVECHFVDPRWNATTLTGLETPKHLGSDGVHPDTEGYKLLASMIWSSKLEWNIPV